MTDKQQIRSDALQLGLNEKQAEALANTFFSLPSEVQRLPVPSVQRAARRAHLVELDRMNVEPQRATAMVDAKFGRQLEDRASSPDSSWMLRALADFADQAQKFAAQANLLVIALSAQSHADSVYRPSLDKPHGDVPA